MRFGSISSCFSSSIIWCSRLQSLINRIFRSGYLALWPTLKLLLLGLLIHCTACTPDASTEAERLGQASTSSVLLHEVSLFDKPNGQVEGELSPGAIFSWTGQVSSKLLFRRIGNDTLLEPFLQVRLADSSVHWVYANPHNFNLALLPENWSWKNRLRAILSPEQFRNYEHLMQQWEQQDGALQLLLLFQFTRQLRDDLQLALSAYPLLPTADYDDVLPACIPYSENGRSAWWLDYNTWHQRAAAQSGAEAEAALFNFYAKRVYPPDGIEYGFPTWHFPVSQMQSHSLLGRGIHLQLLQELDSLELQYPFVRTEWERLRTDLLADIIAPETTYWEDLNAIDQELQQIQSTQWSALSAEWVGLISLHRERLIHQGAAGNQFNYRNR